ncbi:hypothetical protein ACRWQL_00765 (plasmid) [Shewanella sp. HL-SH4]|uniref:hypothetical protein n=1 Tax=Shewanella sp. HL-SH4 TaxID=3436240 RepID=UPI003EBFB2EA
MPNVALDELTVEVVTLKVDGRKLTMAQLQRFEYLEPIMWGDTWIDGEVTLICKLPAHLLNSLLKKISILLDSSKDYSPNCEFGLIILHDKQLYLSYLPYDLKDISHHYQSSTQLLMDSVRPKLPTGPRTSRSSAKPFKSSEIDSIEIQKDIDNIEVALENKQQEIDMLRYIFL